jgi:hypothetical protein
VDRAIGRALATLAVACAVACAALLRIDDVGYNATDASSDGRDAALDEQAVAVEAASQDPCPDVDAADFLDADYDVHPSTAPSAVCDDSGLPRDLGGDPANCGACGHSCRGGACAGGFCAPTEVVATEGYTILYDRDDSYMYFASANSLSRAPTDGGAVETLLDAAALVPTFGRASDGRILAISQNPSEIVRFDIATQAFAVVPGSATPVLLALAPAFIYWTSYLGRDVLRAPLDGGREEVVFGTSGLLPQTIAFDGTQGFWAEWDDLQLDAGSALGRYDPDSGASRYALPDQWGRALALDATYVYWSDAASGRVYRSPRSAPMSFTPIAVLPPGLVTYWTVAAAVDARNLYFGAQIAANGGVVMVPKCGGRPRQLVERDLPSTGVLALDESSLYYVAYNGSGIFRVPK